MKTLFDTHIKFVDAVNSSKTEEERDKAGYILLGFRAALSVQGINQLMDCDNYYMDKGINRPMCCGVFLDWQGE